MEIEVHEFVDITGYSPFQHWFNKLDNIAATKVTTALYRLEIGNFSNVKSVGSGIFEYKIHFGPGYRLYFGQKNDRLIILLGGGSKKHQSKDISKARKYWGIYKQKTKEKNDGPH